MKEGSLVRVRIEAPPTPSLMSVLRRAFPFFAQRPVAVLSTELQGRRRWVVSAGRVVDEAALRAAGVHVEPVGDDEYTSGYVRRHLPSPPELEEAPVRLIVVLRPSFEPEVVIHAWAIGELGALHVASREVSLWERDFIPTHQADLECSADEERSVESRGLADPSRVELLTRAVWELRRPTWLDAAPLAMADGTMLTIDARIGEDRCVFEDWLMDPASVWFAQVVALGREVGIDPPLLARAGA